MKWDVVTDQALPSRQVTHLHFIRHGRVETGGLRMAYGHLDLPLSAEGERQTREVVERVLTHFEGLEEPWFSGPLTSWYKIRGKKATR